MLLAHPRVQPELRDGIAAAALPSGHATAAMSLAVAAILIAPRSLRIPAAVFGAAFALAQGVALVVLAWHYPSDVLAGFLIATAFGFAGPGRGARVGGALAAAGGAAGRGGPGGCAVGGRHRGCGAGGRADRGGVGAGG